MGTAWRGPSQVGKGQFDRVLSMTSQVRDMGMEVRPARYCLPHHSMPCTHFPSSHLRALHFQPSDLRFMRYTASYDVASNMRQALGGGVRHTGDADRGAGQAAA